MTHDDTLREAIREFTTIDNATGIDHSALIRDLEQVACELRELDMLTRTLVGYVESRTDDAARPKESAAAARKMIGNMFDVDPSQHRMFD